MIEGNVISHCMKVLNDGAGIYCSRGKKTVLRGNQAYDIQSNKGLAIAYYFDEDSIDCLLEGNSAVNCPTPFLAHLSEKIIIRNNYFYSQKPMIIKFANSRNFVWENNLFVGDKDFSFTCYLRNRLLHPSNR